MVGFSRGMMIACIAIAFALAGSVTGRELVLNGNFEDGLDSWPVEFDNDQGSYDISTCTSYSPDPGFSVRVYKYMRYFARLSQTVEIPDINTRFSTSAKLAAAKGTLSGYFAFATLNIEYLRAAGTALGRTMITSYVGDHPPQNTHRQHVYSVSGDDWEDYGFVVADELRDNLPGINPDSVTGIRLVLESYGTGRTG